MSWRDYWGNKMEKVSRRGGFSDRNGIKTINTEIQLKNFDERTRTRIRNKLNEMYMYVYRNNYTSGMFMNRYIIDDFNRFVKGEIYSQVVEYREGWFDDQNIWNMINDTINNGDYDDVLTVVEAIVQYWDLYLKEEETYSYYNPIDNKYIDKSIYEEFNNLFKDEYIGYRFVDGLIVPISDRYEIETINDALELPYENVYEHLAKANKYLSDRQMPDYENSIKESISAVEAICIIKTGLEGKEATLGRLLKKLEENNIKIHSGLKSAFNILYGYTSDANGIRHAGDIGGPASTFEEAKFMLVTCCAFINYLVALTADI